MDVGFGTTDHAKTHRFGQANSWRLRITGGAVTFLRRACCGLVTSNGGMLDRFYPLSVEKLVAPVLTFGYAKGTSLYGLLLSIAGLLPLLSPPHLVRP